VLLDNKDKEVEVGGICGTHEEEVRHAYRILVGIPDRKELFGTSRRRWE
jgi:hypothetical protein